MYCLNKEDSTIKYRIIAFKRYNKTAYNTHAKR